MLFLVFILFLSFLNCSIFPFFSICQLLHVIPLKLSHGSCMFYSIFFILFSFHVGTFLLICIPVNWFFLHCVQSMDGTIKGLILSVTVIFISSTSFDSYITHLFLHVATFSTRALNSLIIILNSLSIIPTSMSYVSLVLMIAFSFQSVFFFLLLACLVIFCWKFDMLYRLVRTEVNRTLLCGFMLIWIKGVLCLILLLSINIKGFQIL